MALTYGAIATVTVGSGGASTIVFNAIPQIYTDLLLRISARDGNNLGQNITFNSSTSGYSAIRLQGSGTNVGSETGGSTNIFILCNDNRATATTFGSAEVYITNYTSSNNKRVSSDSITVSMDTSFSYQALVAGLWSNSAAINSITITPEASPFTQYSTATLYGIKNTI